MNLKAKPIFWWAALIAYAFFLFYTSSRPLPEGMPLPIHPLTDKAIHFGEYLLFALLSFKVFGHRSKCSLLLVITVSLAYAGFNEAYQIYVPQRNPSIYDMGANSAGIFLGALLQYRVLRIFRSR